MGPHYETTKQRKNPMAHEELFEADLDFEDDVDFEAEEWDEEALGLDGADLDPDSLAREIGVRP
jgi:hypothetical protein